MRTPLNGPIPGGAARPVAHTTAMTGALLAPLLVSVSFLRAPVLPTVALEIDDDPGDREAPTILIGEVTAVDDTMTTMLDRQGNIQPRCQGRPLEISAPGPDD